MALFAHRAGNVVQGFGALQAHLEHLAGRHALDQKFGLDEGKGADLGRYVEMEVDILAGIVFRCVFHAKFLLRQEALII